VAGTACIDGGASLPSTARDGAGGGRATVPVGVRPRASVNTRRVERSVVGDLIKFELELVLEFLDG
jgi:hypothetical protein